MKIEWVQQCVSCRGSGIYAGIGECQGAGVVCHTCDGTGRQQMLVEYNEFTGLKSRSDIRMVYPRNCGYKLSDKLPGTEGGGIPYLDWLKNPDIFSEPKREMRGQSCPHLWTGQEWSWDGCKALRGGDDIRSCKHFCNKAKCWDKFDRELPGKND